MSADAAQSEVLTHQALAPHRYPVWIIGFAGVVVAACLYSSFSMPKYYLATKELRAASKLDAVGDHRAAQKDYRDVLAAVPSSREARIGLAYSLFADDNQANDRQAMLLLFAITLSKDEWSHLKNVMPSSFQSYFTEVKE